MTSFSRIQFGLTTVLVYDCPYHSSIFRWRRDMSVVKIAQAQGRVPVTIFQLQDRVNLGNFAELEDTAKEAYNNGTRDLVMDLSQTVSLTSIGIRAIVIIHKMLSSDGGKHLKIANPMPYIREMLEISGVTEYIEIYNTVDEAVASF
jgi:anti-anti-sigma factor